MDDVTPCTTTNQTTVTQSGRRRVRISCRTSPINVKYYVYMPKKSNGTYISSIGVSAARLIFDHTPSKSETDVQNLTHPCISNCSMLRKIGCSSVNFRHIMWRATGNSVLVPISRQKKCQSYHCSFRRLVHRNMRTHWPSGESPFSKQYVMYAFSP